MSSHQCVAVIIVSDYGEARGGAAKVAIATARGLAERGIAVTFLCATPPGPELRHELIRVECIGMEDVWHQSAIAGAVTGIFNRRAAQALKRLLAAADPRHTIIHFHQWTKALSPAVLRVAARSGFRAFVTAHDYLCVCPNGRYYDFNRSEPCSLSPLSARCLARPCDPRSYAHKAVRVARQLDLPALLASVQDRWAFVHISSLAADVSRRFLPARARHFVITDPIDVPREAPVAVAANSSFLYVGRFEREKGCSDLAEAARDHDVVFMGEGPERDTIARQNPAARYLSWGTSAAVADALRRCRALVLPSLWYETFGMVVPEALARGVPVVVSSRVGAKSLVEHGVNGLVFAAADVEALRQSLAVLTSREVAATMGAAAYARYWAAPPSLDRHLDQLIDAYDELLTDRRVAAMPDAARAGVEYAF